MATDQARIITEIYDAAAEPGLWPRALESVASAFGAAGAGYFVYDKRSGAPRTVTIVGPATHIRDDYIDHYASRDPYRRVLATAPLGVSAWATRCFLPGQLRRDEWYNDFIVPSGINDILGTRIFDDGRDTVMLGLHHAVDQRSPAVDPPRHLRPLLDALGQAAGLHCRLDRAEWKSAIALRALDRVATGVMIADETGRVLECNAAAERILAIDDGLSVRAGILAPRRAFEVLRLARLIATAAARTDQAAGHMLVGRSNGHASYVVTVAPLSAEVTADARPLAMILVADPDEHAPSREHLAEFFGFSPAESRLAAALMEGRRLDQIAGELGVRISTLRTQLSSVLKKAGVERQADLMRVLSTVRLIETTPPRR